MKEKIWKMFSANNNTVYVDKLDDLVEKYNKSFHRGIKMSPFETSEEKNEKVFSNLYGDLLFKDHKGRKFNVGGKVKISAWKRQRLFDKGFSPNWTEEIFILDESLETDPVTYELVDLKGEKVTGSFYEEELQKTNQEVFRIKEVLKVDGKNQRGS